VYQILQLYKTMFFYKNISESLSTHSTHPQKNDLYLFQYIYHYNYNIYYWIMQAACYCG